MAVQQTVSPNVNGAIAGHGFFLKRRIRPKYSTEDIGTLFALVRLLK
jgi:hypothetical protein